ncbi:AI-2E family transporter [Acetivibrio saccincola]|uniref:AI-2E family transporter n=1 Tax=Acetivibrio saccincola TaxID=1677857 RepID=UPI0010572B20|nr:AI-2E family transporter [Acetivibrio saccincola]NLW27052.1 AI-2E family transporter [Acetivibrio saccincola]HOA97176.1 AI-2E family transporter [Acetivibrio saccincola]
MLLFKGKKIPHSDYIPIIIIGLLLYKLINNPSIVLSEMKGILKYITSLFAYIIWGFAIAYFLNPLMVLLEKKLKIRRIFSISIIYVVFIATLGILITFITPAITSSVKQLANDIPDYIETTEAKINETIEKLKSYDKYGVETYIKNNLERFSSKINNFVNVPVNFLLTSTISLTSYILKFLIGLIISIYILADKEKIIKGAKKLTYALLNKKTAFNLISNLKKSNYIFSKYMFGKALDSLIIGILCLILLSVFRVKFALLFSLIVGVTNMIPYVGPFVGAIPAVVVTLFINPIQAIWVAIIIFLLQQFDGWYLGPKIIGDQVGVSPLLIITAIIVGGGMFGASGMFLGVPVFTVIKAFVDEYVEKKLKAKGFSFD